MASLETIGEIAGLLFNAPLANKPKERAGQTESEAVAATVRVFGVALRDIDDDLLKAATVQHIATSKWFPAVADLRQIAVGLINRADDMPDSYTAWGQIKRALGGGSPPHPMAKKAIDALGGLHAFGMSDVSDEPAWRSRFIQAYENYQLRQAEEAMTPPAVAGYIEKRRELNGQSVGELVSGLTSQMSGRKQLQ
ncbi:MAG: hypothetical protein IAF02_16495 [Anaerolineae bacterium]|nr:hypothetical protein [Anaerolineae bacterium]